MIKPGPLHKTTIIIWSEYDATCSSLANLGRDAIDGEAYCSQQTSVLIADPTSDPDWDGTEFFGGEDDEEEDDAN